ncbi:hypothetical protein MKW92_029905 [Papaver armeniacum]|nr:hypothetical protein MKW92_029905 [Papaver armeniacum]
MITGYWHISLSQTQLNAFDLLKLLSDFGFNLGCFSGKFEPEKERVFTDKEIQDYVRPYAMDAISFYNEITGTKYELVEPGCFSHAPLSGYLLTHIDFTAKKTAKKTDVADAPEEMFFAELTTINKVNSVKVCKCMGRKESISGDKNNGCYYCMEYLVQHPRDGGFMAGGVGLFTDEERNF